LPELAAMKQTGLRAVLKALACGVRSPIKAGSHEADGATWKVASAVGVRRLVTASSQLLAAYADTLCFVDEREHPGVHGLVALTIDDGLCRQGPEHSLVPEVRALLKEHGAHATFFVCSEYLSGLGAEGLLSDGNELGNHMTHDSHKWARGPIEDFETDLLRCGEAIRELQPQGTKWFRAPGGKLTAAMGEVLDKHGLRHALGDCYCDDWAIEDSGFVARTLVGQAHSGSVVILHMPERGLREHCLVALRGLLEGLRAKGLRCVTLSALASKAPGILQEDSCAAVRPQDSPTAVTLQHEGRVEL